MESCSENSFAWTDTSSDSFNSISLDANDSNFKSHETSDFKNQQNMKLKGQKDPISNNTNDNETQDEEPKLDIKEEKLHSKNKNHKKKKIKLEPDSDNDLHKKRTKPKHIEINENQKDDHNSVLYDEPYLNMKVKQEESSVMLTKKKQIKRKRESSTDTNDSTKSTKINISINGDHNKHDELKHVTNELEDNKSKKKKKKSKEPYHDSDHIEEKIDIGETIISKRDISYKNLAKNNKVNHSTVSTVSKDNSFEESDESSCAEISAIKCDEDYISHTISFNNKSFGNDDSKKNSNNILSENIVRSTKPKQVPDSEPMSHVMSAPTQIRKSTISDRIQFEDEDNTNMESSYIQNSDYGNSKKSSRVKQFLKTNPNLKLLTDFFYCSSNLSQDDEIWILKCPKEIDTKAFIDKDINIHEKFKVKLDGQTYDGSTEEEHSDSITLFSIEQSRYNIQNVPLNGIINLRKRIPKAHFRDDNVMVNNQTNFIPLPETKCRHPLFGANYKKALKIPASVAERLNTDSNEAVMKSEKKKKKKNRDKNTSEQVDLQEQTGLPMKSEPDSSFKIGEKKRKKRKIVDDEGPAPKKVKRIKHDPESAEAWESEKAIEENLFNF